jgi:hypothetical protein
VATKTDRRPAANRNTVCLRIVATVFRFEKSAEISLSVLRRRFRHCENVDESVLFSEQMRNTCHRGCFINLPFPGNGNPTLEKNYILIFFSNKKFAEPTPTHCAHRWNPTETELGFGSTEHGADFLLRVVPARAAASLFLFGTSFRDLLTLFSTPSSAVLLLWLLS